MNAGRTWLILGVECAGDRPRKLFPREPHVKSHRSKTTRVKGWEKLMSVSRKRFRIEEAIMGDVQLAAPGAEGGDPGPRHREIMAELRALRAQRGAGTGPSRSAVTESAEASVAR